MQMTCILENNSLLYDYFMIIGFLGKGGSGKSSVASQMAFFEQEQGKSILAIDADHNLDLSFNLSAGSLPDMNYLSQSLPSLLNATGNVTKYDQVFLEETDIRFRLSPLSKEIEDYSVLLQNNIRLMAAGPQTQEVLHGQKCSHSLTTPLKVLLPLLELNNDEVVIIDEKAGADGVSTGVVTGMDAGVIVCEPSLHSVKTAKQIAELMDFYETPYVFVGNKITSSEDEKFIITALEQNPTTFLPENTNIKRNPSVLVSDWQKNLSLVTDAVKQSFSKSRLERTTKKFSRNQAFAQH